MRLSSPLLLAAAVATASWTFLDVVAHLTQQPIPPPQQQQQQQQPLLYPPPNNVHVDGRSHISENTYDELERFAKYASAVYQFLCPRPLGNTLVRSFSNVLTHAHGFVARDDERREIVVAFRGSYELADMITDGNLVLVPLVSRGVEKNNTASVHAGFLLSYNSVRSVVIRVVRGQLLAFPHYVVVITGHSLGGALASIAALSVKSNTPSAVVRLFTYGQPRTGDAAYADLLETIVGHEDIFRAVHTWDGVPTMIPESLGYRHHACEYWQFEEPPNSATVHRCEGQENKQCSHSIPSTGINLAHGVYFGHVMSMGATLCL